MREGILGSFAVSNILASDHLFLREKRNIPAKLLRKKDHKNARERKFKQSFSLQKKKTHNHNNSAKKMQKFNDTSLIVFDRF